MLLRNILTNKNNTSVSVAEAQEISRLREQLENYKHAFQTTAADRDRIKASFENLNKGVQYYLSTMPALDAVSPPTAGVELVEKCEVTPYLSDQELADCPRLYLPNVFCVGAPKTATSFLYSILRQHSSVSMSQKDNSQISHLCFNYNWQKGSELLSEIVKQFLRHQNDKYNGEPILCNFTVDAFLHSSMARFIKQILCEDARILVMLRNPVKRAVSEYAMRVTEYDQKRDRFVEPYNLFDAIELETRNVKDGKGDNENTRSQRNNYIGNGQYGKLIKPFFDEFGERNIKVIIFEEEILSGLEKTIFSTFEFMGIRDQEVLQVAVKDHSRYAEISKAPNDVFVYFQDEQGNKIGADLSKTRSIEDVASIKVELTGGNAREFVVNSPSEEDVRAASTMVERHKFKLTKKQEAELYRNYFHEDVVKLESLIGRDLSVWYENYV